ncbi:MAG: OmpA family protein [Bacteroidales bacterium]|jgi:chemotaxis protein MotB|nr:OmpA family protein [Bacteroidales bacterium]
MKRIIFIFIAALVLSSCVSQKKFQTLQDSSQLTQDSLRTALGHIQKEIFDLQQRNDRLNKDLLTLRADTTSKNRQIQNLLLQVQDLEELNNNLVTKQSRLMQQNAQESRKILEEIQFARRNLQKQQDALDSVRIQLDEERKNLDLIRNELGIKNDEILTKNKKIAEMEEMIRRKDSISNALRMKVKQALVGFEGQGLSIEERNGKIYVLLDEALLFNVGKSDVASKGQEALRKLAEVLAQNPDIDIMVEGHTDNTGGSKRNWELSAERALAISQILLQNTSIEGSRITVAGRGQYMPVDTANTSEARSKNRRSEIILTPDLEELYNLIHEN